MKLLRNFLISCVLAVTMTAGAPVRDATAQAFAEIGTGYIVANYNSLVTTYLLSQPPDSRPPKNVDGYARIFACPLVMEYYKNEFEWRKVRDNMNMSINRLDREYFSYYEFSGSVDLDPYDFEKEIFPLNVNATLQGVRLLNMFRYSTQSQRGEKNCAHAFNKGQQFIAAHLPTSFSVRLPTAINFKEIAMTPKEAERFVNTVMPHDKTNTRKVHIRFRVRLDAIADTRISGTIQEEVIFNGQLLEMDVFADKELTQHMTKIEL